MSKSDFDAVKGILEDKDEHCHISFNLHTNMVSCVRGVLHQEVLVSFVESGKTPCLLLKILKL